MKLELADCIRTYFDISNGCTLNHVTDCFSPDARVFDEGRQHSGHAAIEAWQQAARKTFEYSVVPISASREVERVAVIARVSGNFPGSPVELNHLFELNDGKIRTLEIH